MLSFYDAAGELRPVPAYEDYSITHKLDGCDKLTFCVDTSLETHHLLQEECEVLTDDNCWIVKKIDDDKIDCELNFDFLKRSVMQNYESKTRTLAEVLEDHLPDGWTVEGAGVSSIKRTIRFDYCTDYDVIYKCMNVYKVYFVWHIRDKRLSVFSPKEMQPTGEYITTELNLKSLSSKGSTKGFATRLYAYGKDGMTIEDAIVDGERYGKTFVENKAYADKTVCAYWSDERYTVAQNLYEDALDVLAGISIPTRSYECSVVDLARMDASYSFLSFSMHKKITLIDPDRNIKVEHQIVEYKEYPDEPERNKVTLSCVPETVQDQMNAIESKFDDTTEKIATDYEARINMVTAMLTGAFGGYVYSDGSELFIMDNPNPAEAQMVWRWNINGFGKSSTGIDGPYTTAITFDDQFITSVINAMVIRGSLIEAGSIQAEKISAEYTDGVITASYTAAQGYVDALFSQINNYLTNDEETGQIDVIQKTITEIKQSIDGLRVEVEKAYTGGINYVKNSSGLNGLTDDWTHEGHVTTTTDNTKNYTVAESCFLLSEGATLSQTIEGITPEKDYYISLKTRKTQGLNSTVKILYNDGNEAILFSSSTKSGWLEASIVLKDVQSTEMTISISTINGGFYVADILVCEGNAPRTWSPAPNEIYTTNVIIDYRGIKVKRDGSSESTVIDNHEFAGYYNDEKVFYLSKDETYIHKTIVDGELTVGTSKVIPYQKGTDAGINITILD